MEAVLKTAFPYIVISVGVLAAFQGVLMIVAYTVLGERKILGWMHLRCGPMYVGWFGLLQPIADAVKLFFKESFVPPFVEKPFYVLAPAIPVVTAVLTFVAVVIGLNFVAKGTHDLKFGFEMNLVPTTSTINQSFNGLFEFLADAPVVAGNTASLPYRFTQGIELRVSVNLSVRQFRDARLIDTMVLYLDWRAQETKRTR